ncbi:MAG: ABC transporter permease [Candidatus Rokubacteria bacterium]|nr:ABC transporter permease [Candidatus Rokubacteria bacterium]
MRALLLSGHTTVRRTMAAAPAVLREPMAVASGVIVLGLVATAIFAPQLAPYPPNDTALASYRAPGSGALLGTDKLGRDILSRLIWGARITLYVGVISVGVSITLGTLWGIVTAYIGGFVDTLTQRCVDTLMALPPIVLALSIMAAVGQSTNNVILALGTLLAPTAIRTVRPIVLSMRETAFVEAARGIGCSRARIVCRHIVPNCLSIYIVLFTINMGYAVVVEASLSFLGVGIPLDEPSWGGMLAASMADAARAPWLLIFPAIAIFVAVLGLNLLGDTVRDLSDPRTRRERRHGP